MAPPEPGFDISVLRDFREAIEAGSGGEVVLRAGSEVGRVFFVKGRIAWAAVSTIKRTFFAYLVEQTELTKEQLGEVFDACKASGANFGETIVEWELLDEQTLRTLLLHHLSECLLEILSWSGLSSMFVPEQRSYKGSLTFELHEVLEMVIELDTGGRLPFGGMSAEEILSRLATDAAPGQAGEVSPAQAGPEVSAQAIPEETRDDEAVRTMDRPARNRAPVVLAVVLLLGLASAAAIWFWRESRPTGVPAGPKASVGLDARAPGVIDARPDRPAAAAAKRRDGRIDARPDGSRRDGGPDRAARADSAAADSQAHPGQAVVVGAEGEGQGSVFVISRPAGARIFLDGVGTGRRTPFKLRALAASIEHVIMIERERYRPEVERFKLAPNMEAKLRFTLHPGRLPRRLPAVPIRFESTPAGAAILVNGQHSGKVTPAQLSFNPHRIWQVDLRLKGFLLWRRRIRPVPDVPLVYRATLKEKRVRRGRRRGQQHR